MTALFVNKIWVEPSVDTLISELLKYFGEECLEIVINNNLQAIGYFDEETMTISLGEFCKNVQIDTGNDQVLTKS